MRVPVRVFGHDFKGRVFSEDNSTLVVSRNGALIPLSRPLINDQTVLVINRKNHKESDFRVVSRQVNDQLRVEGWGMECLNPGQDFWDLVDSWRRVDSSKSNA